MIASAENTAVFSKTAEIKNYSGTTFHIKIDRAIKVLDATQAFSELGITPIAEIDFVAYQSINTLQNMGPIDWNKQTGILSVWVLGMFNPSPAMTIIVPFKKGNESVLGPIVNDDYFGKVPPERLKIGDGIIYFKADGQYRSKIGNTTACQECYRKL